MSRRKKSSTHGARGSGSRGSGSRGSGARAGGACDWYNRARRRLRCRKSAGERPSEPEFGSAAMAEFASRSWEGPSGPYLQQVMPGWRAGLVRYELTICLALLAIAMGGAAVLSFLCWTRTAEVELDYTGCANATPAHCQLELRVPANLTAPVYLYYAMRNAYFNHRKIQVSWSLPQLLGLKTRNLTKSCGRRAYRDGLPVLPCGVLPDAIFNDTFAITGPYAAGEGNGTGTEIQLSSEGISWPWETRGLFQPLPTDRLAGTVRPNSWPEPAIMRYRRPFQDAEDLQEWLRTPAFSSFRKMRHCLLLPSGGLGSGNYRLVIGNNYPVSQFGGSKRLIVAEKSAFGGKNLVLVLLPLAACAIYLLLCVSTLVETYLHQLRHLVRCRRRST